MSEDISTILLSELGRHITRQMGLHFSERNWSSLRRGLKSAAQEFGYADSESCARWLLSSRMSSTQVDTLARHLTIGETYFFRDTKIFEALENRVLPEILFARQSEERRLRIWSAGCSSGEEPYSIAILLTRLLPNIEDWNISILATDLNVSVLQKAQKGVYSDWSFRSPPSWLKERYFRRREKSFELSPTIKRMVTFAPLNLAEDVYPSLSSNTNAIDIIFCRNVIMYFPLELQQKVIQQFHHALVHGGWLIVSPSEASSHLFPQYVTVNFPGTIFFMKGEQHETQPSLWFARMPHDEQLSYSDRLYSGSHAQSPQENASEGDSAVQHMPFFSAEAGSADIVRAPAIQNTAPSPFETVFQDAGAETLEDCLEHARELYRQGAYEALLAKLLPRAAQSRESETCELIARAYANQGCFAKALGWCDKALEIDKLNPSTHYLKATILQEEQQNEHAIASLRRTLFLDRDFVLAYVALGNLVRQQGRIKESAKYFETARQLLQHYAPNSLLPESDGMTAERVKEFIHALLSGEE